MLELPIGKEDIVVAAFPFREYVVVLTKYGKVFRLSVSDDPTGGYFSVSRVS